MATHLLCLISRAAWAWKTSTAHKHAAVTCDDARLAEEKEWAEKFVRVGAVRAAEASRTLEFRVMDKLD